MSREFSEEFADKFDYLEFRLDRQEKYCEFPQAVINNKTIITIRDIAEGGKKDIPFSEKFRYYEEVVAEHNCLVDLELKHFNHKLTRINTKKRQKSHRLTQIFTDEINIQIQCSSVKVGSDNLILSYHNFSDNLEVEKLQEIIDLSNSIPSKFLKIAVNIEKYSDLLTIQSLISKSNKPVIFAGMGKLGKISRVLYQHFGAYATFVGLNDFPTARGQLTIKESEKYNLQKISKSTKIGGIVGGKQIEKSLGISFYNEYFRKNKINAVYLPFVVENFDVFWKWINNSKLDFYGFSITMPYKREAGERKRETGKSGFAALRRDRQYKEFSVVNLYLPKTNEFLNTDLIAFRKAFEYLQIKKDDKILVYGSGGTAETALFVFQEFPDIYLSGRNEKIGKELAAKYNAEFIPQINLSKEGFDLIINCTSIGMNNEDFLKITNLKLPAKIIDLTYTDRKTPLIQRCEQENIPFVDGKMFWKRQAEKQLEKFVNVVQNLF